jgi:hypothetical protein
MTARRAKRENGGLGEDPPGSTMTYYQVLRTSMFSQGLRMTFFLFPGGKLPPDLSGSLRSGLLMRRLITNRAHNLPQYNAQYPGHRTLRVNYF